MKKWRIAVGILLVFAVGTAAGAYGTRMILKKRISRVLHTNGPPGIRVIQDMVQRLNLSDSQRKSIDAILNTNNKKWETIRQEYEPQVKALFKTVIEETEKVLTAQQREEIERMSANVQRRLPRRSSAPPPASSPPDAVTPPENISPPSLSQPFGPKINEERIGRIVEQLKLDKEKSAEVQSIVRASLQRQNSLMADFLKSREDAKDKYLKEKADEQMRTEKKLQGLLTPDQMKIYEHLEIRDDFHRDGFNFDVRQDAMDHKGF